VGWEEGPFEELSDEVRPSSVLGQADIEGKLLERVEPMAADADRSFD
jgi:hypothetical protein